MDATGPILPAWIVFPLAMLALVIIAGYQMAMKEALAQGLVPPSRARIRGANGWVMTFTVPMLAYAFGMTSPDRPEVFIWVWTASVAMIAAIVMFAIADAINTLRLANLYRRTLRAKAGGRILRLADGPAHHIDD